MPPAEQSFANHAHRPTPTIVATAFLALAIVGFVRWFGNGGRTNALIEFVGIVGCLMTLILISRMYTTALQDRIIRLEMRVRTASLLSPEQRAMFEGLTLKQIAALRFASDPELPALCERAARDRMAPNDIKRAVQTWIADHHRT